MSLYTKKVSFFLIDTSLTPIYNKGVKEVSKITEFTLRLSTELDDSLTKLAEKDGITKTEVIRKALREHIEKQKNK